LLFHNSKWYNPNQTDMDEKIDFLLMEFQGAKLRLDRVVKQFNEEAKDDRRTRRNNLNERRDGSTHRHKMTMMTSHVGSR